jgi:hypothetical protein
MAGIVLPFPGWSRGLQPAGRAHQRPLPFPRTPRLIAPASDRVVPWAVATLLFFTAVLNFYIFQVSVVATSSYELQRLERDRDAWRAQNEQLQVELAKARSLGWIEFQATDRLGMVKSRDSLYIRVAATQLERMPSAARPTPTEVEENDEAIPSEESATQVDLVGAGDQGPSPSILGWLTSMFSR